MGNEHWEHVTKLLLAAFCARMLVPAWRDFILPMVQEDGWKYGLIWNHRVRVPDKHERGPKDEEAKRDEILKHYGIHHHNLDEIILHLEHKRAALLHRYDTKKEEDDTKQI